MMMSAQPLTPSNHNHLQSSKWQEITQIAEQLLLEPDIESQLRRIVHAFEGIFSCQVILWLAEPFSALVRKELLQEGNLHISDLQPLMKQAYDDRHIYPKIGGDGDEAMATVVALPLGLEGQVFGVIQLERGDKPGFSQEDYELIIGLGFQSSLALDWKNQRISCGEQQKNADLLASVIQISKSITSNLDEDNLINSVISLIHQRFGYSQVKLYTTREDDRKVLACSGITQNGVELAHPFWIEDKNSAVSRSVVHQELVLVNDTAGDNRIPPASFDSQTKSELVIPLVTGDKLLGALDLCSEVINAFKPDTVMGFKTLADYISIAIRNARLYHVEFIQQQIAERVASVSGKISADTSLEQLTEDLLAELERVLDCDAAAMWLFDQGISEGDNSQTLPTLKIMAVKVREQSFIDDDQRRSVDSIEIKEQFSQNEGEPGYYEASYPWMREVANSKQPLNRRDPSVKEPLSEILSLPGEYSAMGIPLHGDDQPLGLIIVASRQADIYTSESQLLAATFAKYAAMGIENCRVYSTAHDQMWISTVLLQVASATQSITSLAELENTIVSILTDLTGAHGCTIYLWDQSMEVLYPQASYGYDVEQQARLNAWELFRDTSSLVEQFEQHKRPVVLSLENLPDDTVRAIFPDYDLENDLLILFPMTAQDEIVGAILVDFTNTEFDKGSAQKTWDDKYALIQGVTDQTATAIENLLTLRSREEEAYISIALLQVAQAIVSLNDLDEILAAIVRITPILVGIKRCIIYLWDTENKVLNLSQQYGLARNEQLILGQSIRVNEFPLAELIMERNQIVYYPLESNSSPSEWNEIEARDVHDIESISDGSDEQKTLKLDDKLLKARGRLLIGFPLSIINEVLGVMLVEEEDPIKGAPSYHIREKRIEIVNGITQQTAIAIKNELLQEEAMKSERMERELQLAREIQATFLPDHLPELPGWEMDARWQPAREVGGDFYDVLLLGENQVGLVIADVADKGMPAALFMTLIRTLIRAAAKENLSPAKVLKQVNTLLIPDAKHGMFVTVFYAVIDSGTGKVIYANAGHNPPVVKSTRSGEFTELSRTSMALGISEEIEVEEKEVILNPGDWMVLYTDGVTEAFSGNAEMFGKNRLFDLLSATQEVSPKALLDDIERAIHEFTRGVDLSDDVTLAAIRRLNL